MSHYDDVKACDKIDDTVKEFYDVRNADVVQALNSLDFYNDGICDGGITPIVRGHEIRGRALTVKIMPKNDKKPNYQGRSLSDAEDGAEETNPMNQNKGWKEDFGNVLHEYLDITQPGDVICVDMEGEAYQLGGDHLSLKSLLRGAVGMVVDGGMRDAFGIREVNFPVWTRHIAQKEPVQEMELVAINEPISLGGTKVQPGDLICCDDDGVIAVPKQHEDEVLDAAKGGYEMDVSLRKQKMNFLREEGVDIDIDFTPPSQRREVPANLSGVSEEVWEEVLQRTEEDY
ncbi:RraA family protein [Salinibaculum sp. GCM10025337]